jgi:hypothetical protein
MLSRKRNKIKFKLVGIVGLFLANPCLSFSQYLNQINETPLQFENTLAYNFEGSYLTSINTMSDSNWVQNGWNIIQFKQYDSEFNVINETRFQDSVNVYQQGGRILYFQNEYYFTGYQKDLYLQGNELAYIVKFDQNGDTIWFKNYFDSIPNVRIVFLQVKNERLYIGGYFNYSPDAIQHSFVSEIDTDGNILWTKIFNGFDNAAITKLQPISDGLLLSSGYVVQGTTNHRVVLYKLDFEGNTQWQKTYGLIGSSLGSNFAPIELPNGQLLLYGGQSHPQTEQSGSWLMLTDNLGNVLKDTVYHFSFLDDYFHGYYSPPIIRENDFLFLGSFRESGSSPRNAYLACIDFDFNIKWIRTFGEREIQNRLTFIHDLGNDFYLLSGVVDNDANHPTNDEWFVVVDSMGCDVTDCYLGLKEEGIESAGLSVYPNPTSGKTTFSIGITPTNNSSIVITDLQGRTVKRLEITQKETQIDLELVVDGIYLVHLVESGVVRATKKLMYAR